VGKLLLLAGLLVLLLYFSRRFTRWLVDSFLAHRKPRPLKVGDRIEVGGVSGEVRRIGARATMLVTEDNIAVIVPNSQFVSERVTNWSHTGRRTAFVVRVRVAWDADAELVRRLLLEAAAENEHVLADPAPEVELRDLRGGRHLSLQVWSTQYLQGEGRLKSDLNFAIRQKLREHAIPSIEITPRLAAGGQALLRVSRHRMVVRPSPAEPWAPGTAASPPLSTCRPGRPDGTPVRPR
jgi:hypothetical protein